MNCNQLLNRIGSIPFVGTVVGIVRVTCALVVMVVTPIIALVGGCFMGIGWTFKSSCWKWDFITACGKTFSTACEHLGVGLAELIPGVGGLVHWGLHNMSEDAGTWNWGKGGCCDNINSETL